jgi:hypothetical protein
MWDCEKCGTKNIAAGLETCPHCGAPHPDSNREDNDMAKATRLGGASGWPDQEPTQEAGTDSSASTEQSERSSNPSEQQSQQPAPSTGRPSEADQTDSSGAPSTDGATADHEPVREGTTAADGSTVGNYDRWRKADLEAEADARGLEPVDGWTIADLAALLRADDQDVEAQQ